MKIRVELYIIISIHKDIYYLLLHKKYLLLYLLLPIITDSIYINNQTGKFCDHMSLTKYLKKIKYKRNKSIR